MIWLDHYESRSYDVMQGFSMGRTKSPARRLASHRSPASRTMGSPKRPADFRLSKAGAMNGHVVAPARRVEI
ncbi:MAG: hypothetical protein WAV18_00280 [Roseiarcus sp.]